MIDDGVKSELAPRLPVTELESTEGEFTFMRMLALAPLLLWTAAAQDVFSSGRSPGGCESARRAEDERYAAAARALQARQRTLEDQFRRELAGCGITNEACRTAAHNQQAERVRLLQLDRADEEATHDKARIDIDAGCEAGASPRDSCAAALAEEDRQYRLAVAERAKRKVDIGNRKTHEESDCRYDSACRAAAHQRAAARLDDVNREAARDDQRRNQARQAIQRDCRTGTETAGGPLKGHVEENVPADGRRGLPLPKDIRDQLMAAAAEMDRAATDAQKSALAASNRFFDCLWQAIRRDLEFLAQPAYVPAAQLAKALHDGTWNYITSNAYSNNRAMFEGAVASLRKLVNDPACTAGAAAPAVAAAAATKLADSAIAANQVRKAADAAVRVAGRNAERNAAWGAARRRYNTGGRNRYNPGNHPNMCFSCSFARQFELETGDKFFAQAYAGNWEIKVIDNVPTKVFNVTHDPTVHQLLKDVWGEKKLQGPPLSPTRLTNQAMGKPSQMLRPDGTPMNGAEALQAIIDELKAAGPGARGIVFIDDPELGHIVDAIHGGKYVNGRLVLFKDTKGKLAAGDVVFPDASNNNIDATHLIQSGPSIKFYRTH